MTKLLEKAFSEAAKVPGEEQDAVAEWLLAELASERRWTMALASSGEALERMADEALEEHSAGRTRKLEPKSS